MSSTEEPKCPNCGKPMSECASQKNYFGTSFKEIREENKKTQKDFADILGLKVSSIDDFEVGITRPTPEQQTKLTTALGISLFAFTEKSLSKSIFFVGKEV